MELEDQIRGIEKTFAVLQVPEKKKVNVGIFYVVGEVNIQWSTVKDKLQGPDLTWAKLLEQLRAKFYPITIQRQKKERIYGVKDER